MTRAETGRDRAKADRQAAILAEAARLFAERGFSGVSLEEIGNAVGVSGPAVYRHFANKQALLAAVLVGVSERLHSGGDDVVSRGAAPRETLEALVAFHVDFALAEADVIRVQDRDLASLSADALDHVRRLQRGYVDGWVGVLRMLRPDDTDSELRLRAQAGFGLLNSTPHSVRGSRASLPKERVRSILAAMAMAALTG
jgi:AcrR family transcriptional regulator